MQQNNSRTAFSLIELSVVILIIGILITGVMKGASLISASRLASARSITAKSSVGEIPDLMAWYETTSTKSFKSPSMANDTIVGYWDDISPKCINKNKPTDIPSGKTCNTLIASSGMEPKYSNSGINSLPAVKFSGNQFLNLTQFTTSSLSSATKIIVFATNSKPLASLANLLNNSNSSPVQQVGLTTSNSIIMTNGNGTNATITSTYSLKTPYILTAIFSNVTGNNNYSFSQKSLTKIATNIGSNTMQGLRVGGGFDGEIAEIIIFSRSLKTSELQEVFSYLNKKYKITLN
jgi:prepilin-type N-terminal cleavage/methylation domain-containing protein